MSEMSVNAAPNGVGIGQIYKDLDSFKPERYIEVVAVFYNHRKDGRLKGKTWYASVTPVDRVGRPTRRGFTTKISADNLKNRYALVSAATPNELAEAGRC